MKAILTGFVLILVALSNAESLDDGLIAYYEFEGNGNDSSGNGNHLTLSGYINFEDGIIGRAITFDGIDDSAVIHQPLVSTLPFTWACWVQIDSSKIPDYWPATYVVIMEQSDSIFSGSNPDLGALFNEEYNSCIFKLYSGNPYTRVPAISQEFSVTTESWFHLVAVARSNGDRQIHVNGIPQGRVNDPEFGAINHHFNMGGTGDEYGVSFFQKYKADEVRIYNRALTDLEIQTLCEFRQMWGKYYVQYLNWVNTEDWLGWLQIELAPWVWSLDYERYFYIPEPPQDSSSGWVYMIRNEPT